jgi:hypothetical protein
MNLRVRNSLTTLEESYHIKSYDRLIDKGVLASRLGHQRQNK